MELSDRTSEEVLISLIKDKPHDTIQKLLLTNLSPDAFTSPLAKVFYKTAIALFLAGKTVTMAEINAVLLDSIQSETLTQQLYSAIQNLNSGTEEELGSLSLHQKRVDSYYTARQGIETIEKWKSEAIKYPLKVRETMPVLASKLLNITEGGTGEDPRPSIIISRAEQEHSNTPVSTGMSKVDRILKGGFTPGHLHMIGGPTGHGKTSLACSLTVNVACKKPVLYISTEMKAVDILYRVITNYTGMTIDEVMFPPLDDLEILDRKQKAIEFIDQRIRVYQTARTVNDIVTRMRWHVSEFGELGLVIVDHLHRLQGLDDKTIFTSSKMKENSLWRVAIDNLHEAAKKLFVPMVVFGQLSDEVSRELKLKGNVLQLSFKESGDLANESDYGWLLFRDRTTDNVGHLLLKKNRFRGEEASVTLYHDPERYYFCDAC